MPFFVYLLVYAAAFVLAELFKPKPDLEDARPAGLGDFNFPTATEGRAVPLLWGTVDITAPNVIWYGDLRTDRIREKVRTSMFSSKKVTVGYNYYLGLQFGICRGPLDGKHDGILAVQVDDEYIYDGFTTSPRVPVSSGTIAVNQPALFGENSGGIVGNFGVFPGTETQLRSTYLEGAVSGSPDILPAYRGTHHVVAEQIGIGSSPSLRPFKFTSRRIPMGLTSSLSPNSTGLEIVNGLDANPMYVLYEILTNADWGLAISSSEIDVAGFVDAATTLHAEGNGFSAILDNPQEASALINEIERQCDGVLTRDTATGVYVFTLIREATLPSPASSMLVADESNCEGVEFSRATWSETTNEVRVEYSDPNKNYAKSFALAQDMANQLIQNANVSVTEKYMGVKNAALANSLAWRDIRSLAIPLAKANITVNREFYDIKPGDPFLLTWPLLGITELLMRVSRVDFGELLNNKITIDAVEDVFTTQAASFGDPIDSSWTEPTQTVAALAEVDQLIFETPRMLQLQDTENPLEYPRITHLARLTGGSGDEYVTHTRQAVSTPALAATQFIENLGSTPNFVKCGILRTQLDATDIGAGFPIAGTGSAFVDPISESLAPIIDAAVRSTTDINNLLTCVYITSNATPGSPDTGRDYGEFVLYKQCVESIGGSPLTTGVELDGIYRGALDSNIQEWPAGSRVWFIGFGGTGITSEQFTESYHVDAKMLPSTQESGTLAIGDATPSNVAVMGDAARADLPLSPFNVRVQNILNDNAISVAITSNDVDITWQQRNWRTLRGINSVTGLNDDGSTFDPDGADAGDGLSYIWELYDESLGSPSLIAEGVTPADDALSGSIGVDINDILGMTDDVNSAPLRIEVQAQHLVTSPASLSRDKRIHRFNANISTTYTYDAARNLGRIPYGATISPGIVASEEGSPGSPFAIPLLRIRFARGARLDDTGGGENGKCYLLIDDASPATLVYDAGAVSPADTYDFQNIDDGSSPSNFAGKTLNILHYHNTGRPIFFHIENQATGNVVAYGVMEPNTSVVPLSINRG